MKKTVKSIQKLFTFILFFILLFFISCQDDFDEIIQNEEKIISEKDLVAENYSPVAGNSGSIISSNITLSGMRISWIVADDDKTSVENLQYKVYISSGEDISTFKNAEINGTELTLNWVVDIQNFDVTGVSFDSIKLFNVFVRDEDGKVSSYKTLSTTIYLYSPGDYTGQIVLPESTSVRADIDSICQSSSNYNLLALSNTIGFISISSTDSISQLADNFSIPKYWPVYGTEDILLADDWADLMDGNINKHLKEAGTITTNSDWWSGSDSIGNFDSINNCGSWKSESNIENGSCGDDNRIDSHWIYSSFDSCDNIKSIVCIGW